MSVILTDPSSIVGHIYVIETSATDKVYVGQTLSHRKNHGKYRPFGYEGRFRDHISEALCNTKKKQCTYLNNAIRLYGKDAFSVSLIETCAVADLDAREQHYIAQYKSMYPSGYNLTCGGKVFRAAEASDVTPTIPLNAPRSRGGCTERSVETRAKMSIASKKALESEDARKSVMKRTQIQHMERKLELCKGAEVDMLNLDKYIRIVKSKSAGEFVRVILGKQEVSFVGKYDTIDSLKQRAVEFLKAVNQSATLPNCSGNP
jgi:hypothetical protein